MAKLKITCEEFVWIDLICFITGMASLAVYIWDGHHNGPLFICVLCLVVFLKAVPA